MFTGATEDRSILLPVNLGAFKLPSDALPCIPGVNGPPPGMSFPEPLFPPEGCCKEFALETLKFKKHFHINDIS